MIVIAYSIESNTLHIDIVFQFETKRDIFITTCHVLRKFDEL